MNVTDLSMRHWPSMAVAVALTVLFGALAIARLPIQLLPTIEEPEVTIANFWRTAAPEEMEVMIVEPQERVLRNTPGVTDISSTISRGAVFVTLTFATGTDIESAKLDFIKNPGLGLLLATGMLWFLLRSRRGTTGDRIAVRGAENLTEDAAVRIVSSDAFASAAAAAAADDG